MKIDFEISHDGLVYRDALNLPDDHALSAEEIESMKMERFNHWLAHIEMASQEVSE